MARTFGDGEDGREAARSLRQTVEQHPECFGTDVVREIRTLVASLLPPTAGAERALAEAEDDCGMDRSSRAGGPPKGPLAESPEQALAEDADGGDLQLGGEPTVTFQEDGLVGFSFRSDGEFGGWVLTVRTDSGWYVSHVIACGAVPATTEMATDTATPE